MIYLLRHAETEWNFQMRKQGLDDSPLTVTGRNQALAYGKVLEQLINSSNINVQDIQIHSSPLGRTKITTQYLVNALSIPECNIHYESRLIEFDYGDWSGLTNEDIEGNYPGALRVREINKWYYTVPNGESYQDVEAKVDTWLEELPEDKTIIAVTHSVVSRVIRGKYLGMPKPVASLLEHPQNMIFKLHNQRIDSFDIADFELSS
ncbi:MAG: histidine phosphatase family protein [Gammaproteobacteria bacterium]